MNKPSLLLMCLCLVFGCAAITRADTVNRAKDESATDFARRLAPETGEMVGDVLETEAFGTKRAVIAFYKLDFKAKYDYTEVHGYLYMPRTGDEYDKVLIDKFEEEGDTPKIESVFFANADKDAAKEMVVICSWRQQHYDVSGTLYATYIFDDISGNKSPPRLMHLKKVSEKVSGGCDCSHRDRTRPNKSFETAGQVRLGLKKLGYKQ
jgi:hypothetical protein